MDLSGRTGILISGNAWLAKSCVARSLSVRLPGIGQYLYPTALLVAVCRARDDDRGVKYSILKRAEEKKGELRDARARLIQHPQGSNPRHATLPPLSPARSFPFPVPSGWATIHQMAR